MQAIFASLPKWYNIIIKTITTIYKLQLLDAGVLSSVNKDTGNEMYTGCCQNWLNDSAKNFFNFALMIGIGQILVESSQSE